MIENQLIITNWKSIIYLNFFGFTDFFSYICVFFVNIDIVINEYCYKLMNKYTYLYTNTSVRFFKGKGWTN